MKRLIASCLFAVAAVGVAHADVAALEKAAVCASCHGEGGAKPIAPNYPVLAGQYRNYLEVALNEYKSGARKNAIMAAQATNLSDADIKVLATYFAIQPGPLYTPSVAGAAAPK